MGDVLLSLAHQSPSVCACVCVLCVVYICVYVCARCAYVCMCLYMWMSLYECIWMCVYVCVYENVCVCESMCMYVHSSVKVQTHTCPDVCVVVRGQSLDVVDTAGQLAVGFCGFLALPPVSWRGAHWDY